MNDSICLFVCLLLCLSVCQSVCQSVYLSVYLSVNVCLRLHIGDFAYVSVLISQCFLFSAVLMQLKR